MFAESHILDDSEDEYEDDYTESIRLISDLDKKIEHKRELNEKLFESSNVAAAVAVATPQEMHRKSNRFDGQVANQCKVKNVNAIPDATPTTSNSAVRTRASNRLKNLTNVTKIAETSTIIYDANGQMIEVLMEDIDNDEQEFIISDAIDNDFQLEDPFQSIDSNDDELDALINNSEKQIESEPFTLQNVTKTEEDLYMSEESTDDNKNTDDDEYIGKIFVLLYEKYFVDIVVMLFSCFCVCFNRSSK